MAFNTGKPARSPERPARSPALPGRFRHWRLALSLLVLLGASPASRAETLIWPEREAESSAPSQPPDPKQSQPDANPPPQPDTPQQLGSKELAVADSDADQLFFTFQEFTLTGSFTLPEAELRALWDRQPGETASVGDIFRFAEAITATYRARGYLLGFALVPPQDIRAGRFTLRLVEGQLDRLVLTSDPLISDPLAGDPLAADMQALLQRWFLQLQKQAPLTQDQLENFLLRVNRLPGLAAQAILQPGTKPQTTDIYLQARQTGRQINLTASNHLSSSLGREVTTLDLNQPHALKAGDQLSISLRSAPDMGVYRYGRASWQSPPGDAGSTLSLTASQTRIRAKKGALAATGFASQAETASAALVWPHWQTRAQSLSTSLALTSSDSRADYGGAALYHDKLLQLEGRLDYSQRRTGGASWSAGLASLHGLDGADTRANSRTGSHPAFHSLQLGGAASLPFARREYGQFYLRLGLKAQLPVTGKPLPAEAECSFGGRQFGSGFEAGTLSGEACLLGSLKLGWEETGRDIWLHADAGQLRQKGALAAGEKRSAAASSFGLGSALALGE